MSTQSKCQIALKFSSMGRDLKKNESFLAEEYDHGDDSEREKEIEKMTRVLDGKPNPHRHKKDVFKIFGAVSIFEQRGP